MQEADIIFIGAMYLLLDLLGISIISKGALDNAKGGYWFISLLFLFNIFLRLLKAFMDKVQTITVKCVVLLAPFVLSALLCIILPYNIADYFSLMSVRRYWLFLLMVMR